MKNLKLTPLALLIGAAFAATPLWAQAQQAPAAAAPAQAASGVVVQRANASSTSNSTTSNASQATIQQLEKIEVSGKSQSLGGGLMTVQVAPKAVSTISREAIEKASPGANYAQMIGTIPGVVAISDDATGLFDGNYQIRGFTNDEIGVTINGAPANDSGSYRVYATEYGDTENMNDITVLQGYPDVDQAVAGAAGGTIAWSTIDPSHKFSVDTSVTGGSYDYRREFMRVQTGDTGAFRSWISYSHNTTDLWRGAGNATVDKVDGKSVLTLSSGNTISASLQYNREVRIGGYEMLSKAQVAATGYDTNYDTTFASPTDTYYYKLRTNPFKSYLLSLDGEFALSDSLRLSVIPYFQYGTGGAGAGYTFTESPLASNVGKFGYVNYDINGDGLVGTGVGTASKSVMTYAYSASTTWRPGVVIKFAKDFGSTDTMTYGFWYDAPRENQSQDYSLVDAAGNPANIWGTSNLITYTKGGSQPQYNYLDTTTTTLERWFVSNDWTPDNKWTVSLGGAYTYVQRQGTGYQHYGAYTGAAYTTQFGGYAINNWSKFTPTAGVKYQLDTANQFYLGYGQSFRAPVNGVVTQSDAVLAFYQANPSAVGAYLTAAQLAALSINKPETADTVDLGWRFYSGPVSASVDVYASDLKNKQVSGYDNDTGQTIYLTVPELHQRGVNAEASYKIYSDLSMYASYAYTKSTIMENTATFGDGTYPTQGKSFVDTPKNVINLGGSFTHGPFWASLGMNYRSSFWADWSNTERAPGYSTMNFNTGWKFEDVSSWFKKPQLKINVANLTDKRALSFASATNFLATKGAVNDAVTGKATLYQSTATYNELAPRTVMITLSASFN